MLIIVDSTLRDGEQSAGLAFSTGEKIQVGKLLDALGVDVIEAGIPAMGRVEQEAISALIHAGLRAEVTSWNRMHPADIKASLECGIRLLHLSAPVSDIHLEHKLRCSRSWVLGQMREMVAFAQSSGCRVSVGAEDASRADPAFLRAYALAAEEVGVERLRICDTLGILDPFKTYEMVRSVVEWVNIDVEIHAHNDFGMAAANTLAALRAGARAASVTVNGIGERAGNAGLQEVIRAARQFFGLKRGYDANIMDQLQSLVRALSYREFPEVKEAIRCQTPVRW
jgi:homocitrate synthase NifV